MVASVKSIKESILILEKTINEIKSVKNHINNLSNVDEATIDGCFDYYFYGEEVFRIKFSVNEVLDRLEKDLISLESKKVETIADIMRLLEVV